MSPVETRPPPAYTGIRTVVPGEICLMSMFPAVSRGGIVRNPSRAIASSVGTAPCGSGSRANPPRSASAPSLCGALTQLGARGKSQDPGVRVGADTDARELLGLRVLVAVQPPVDDVWIRELVAQEAEARHLDSVAPLLPRVCLNRNQPDLEQIARLRSLDEDRPGEGM